MDNVNALRSIAEMPINLSVEQIGALQAGIKALQEQAERENGCEYCDPTEEWLSCPTCGALMDG